MSRCIEDVLDSNSTGVLTNLGDIPVLFDPFRTFSFCGFLSPGFWDEWKAIPIFLLRGEGLEAGDFFLALMDASEGP